MSIICVEGQYKVVCDLCGDDSLPMSDTFNDAIKYAKGQGWTYDRENDEDYCPECVETEEE